MPHLTKNGWEVYDFRKEFARQGVNSEDKKFRIQQCWDTDDIKNIWDTYPFEVYVPVKLTPNELISCSKFRAKRRFPALSFYYKGRGTTMWRSAQNQTGMMSSRCLEDEYMLKLIGKANDFQSNVAIYDARSQIKAYSNRVKGGGYENTDYYSNCTIEFCSIENIFGVIKGYKKLFGMVNSKQKVQDNAKIFTTIDSSSWYQMIKIILESSNSIARDMHDNRKSVHIHWSDGWDRTAQLCSLTQIILDPYSRTLEGFEVVIEKEWISFGHSFETRCGHLRDENTRNVKRSPVFVQFLDWVYQLIRQFPTCFEFNVNLLCFIAHHVYSWKFGSFLLDTPKYRYQNKLSQKTVSIWSYVNTNVSQFLNPFYSEFDKKLDVRADHISLHFWKEYFLQWTPFSSTLDESDNFVKPDPREELLKKVLEENKKLKQQLASFRSSSTTHGSLHNSHE